MADETDGQDAQRQPEAGEAIDAADAVSEVNTAVGAADAANDAVGDVANPAAGGDPLDGLVLPAHLPPAHARDGETEGQCWQRLKREARAAGMTNKDSRRYAAVMASRVWTPPPEPPEPVEIEPEPEIAEEEPPEPAEPEADEIPPVVDLPAAESGVIGLASIPPSWPPLPPNASLAAEIQWVQSSRLDVVEELPSGAVRVHLDRADRPAPSKAAIGWLETSIRAYSKYCDIAAKATAQQEDEREHVRRERRAVEEVRSMLSEMLDAE